VSALIRIPSKWQVADTPVRPVMSFRQLDLQEVLQFVGGGVERFLRGFAAGDGLA
jgi:hypothetical protein